MVSYSQAEAMCHSEGARLLQIRSQENSFAVFGTKAFYFGNGARNIPSYEDITAIGMKYGILKEGSEPTMYYT